MEPLDFSLTPLIQLKLNFASKNISEIMIQPATENDSEGTSYKALSIQQYCAQVQPLVSDIKQLLSTCQNEFECSGDLEIAQLFEELISEWSRRPIMLAELKKRIIKIEIDIVQRLGSDSKVKFDS